ncbi:MAG: hypothetical protein WBE11_15380 [Candidatus Aminicenantaceae bacterium]
MKVIKGVLEEELQNSIRMKKQYERALSNLPKGSLVEKNIRGHKYYYLAVRQGSKVNFIYKGKLSEDDKKDLLEVKEMRAKYRKLLSQSNKQVSFLKRVLNGKDLRSVS